MPSWTNDSLLEQRIKTHEGESPYVYEDTLGYATIGYGRCIDKRIGAGLTTDEMLYLLRNDISRSKKQLQPYNWYVILDEVRKGVLIELCFNIGLPKLLKFRNTLLALSVLDYNKAADELLASIWARQVGPLRSNDMTNRLRHGTY
jgi:lysozyme